MTTVKITELPRVPRLLLVTSSAHGYGCAPCMEAAHGAEVVARVTGSTGATLVNVEAGNDHYATVDGVRHGN